MDTFDGKALSDMKQRLTVENDIAMMNREIISYRMTMDKESESLRIGYLKRLKKNLKERLKKADTATFDDLGKAFEPDLVNSLDDQLKQLNTLVHFMQVKMTHGDMDKGYVTEETNISRLTDPEKLRQEWPRLADMIKEAYKTYTTVQLCRRIILIHSDIIPNFAVLATSTATD
ncbi:hypothetical protein ACF0H5_004472 [Mactra antiquata]